jgi:tetratricopeptide (TPR) repeat protein
VGMKTRIYGRIASKVCAPGAGLVAAVGLALCSATALGHEVKDLKYGVVLFEFFQQKYFETLVEYEYAAERGGIHNHGTYPELLKGGVSLSYGLDRQAKDIFSKLITEDASKEVQNRAWFYLAKMLYLRGDTAEAATTLANIQGTMPEDIGEEYRYLAALINIKLGYFAEAEAISHGFDDDSPYAPYTYFNLGVAFGKQKDYARAVTNLRKAASYGSRSKQAARLADRSHMAMAFLDADRQNFLEAYAQIKLVSATGIFSNRALLGSGWASVNRGSYREALAPLTVLQRRSMAIPEVQEAVLLLPHVYEKLGLAGRAAEGFIGAYDRYSDTLEQLNKARETLKKADVLELFVRNLDQILGESDWFGTAPSVSLNALSPFLIELMSDHSFQSVLKDLRDLYAIRNNLSTWKRKRDDFEVMIKARSASLDVRRRRQNITAYSEQQAGLKARLDTLTQRAAALDDEGRQRVQWILGDIGFELSRAKMMVGQLEDAPGVSMDTESYARLVDEDMDMLDKELEKTNRLIDKVENVVRELVNAELDVHEERLKYYRVQAHLAKVRILDRSLAHLDDPVPGDRHDARPDRKSTAPADAHRPLAQGGSDAP